MTKKTPKAYFAKLGDFKQLPSNPNQGTERGQYMMEESINRIGAWRSATATSDNIIPAGNHITEVFGQEISDDVIVVETDGKQLVIVKRQDISSEDPRAMEYAVLDNRTSEVGLQWDADVMQAMAGFGVDLTTMFHPDELAEVLMPSGEGGSVPSDGSLLSLVEVTIDEPQHKVHRGDIWILNEHILVCADVMKDWPIWSSHLQPGVLFVPYPGPFVPLTEKAHSIPLVMVQPDPYIAGHLLDRWTAIHGKADRREV